MSSSPEAKSKPEEAAAQEPSREEAAPTEPPAPDAAPNAAQPSVTSSSIFSMFGGGAREEKKEEEDRGDVSGSARAQREAAKAEEVTLCLQPSLLTVSRDLAAVHPHRPAR